MGTSRLRNITRCILFVMGNFMRTGGHCSDERVYLDWNATAPPCEDALEAWNDCMRDAWANANSLHAEGGAAAGRLKSARESLARRTGTSAGEWIFTSGGTESIHAAIYGMVKARRGRKRIVTSQGEHACVRAVMDDLESQGFEIVRVGLDGGGRWDALEVARSCDENTALVSLIWANNETGAVSDVQDVAERLLERRVPLHLDAVQVPGRIPFRLDSLPVGLVSISGHKFRAPKGIGALFVRRGSPWARWMLGGEQERGRRAGTSNVAGAAAMAAALEIIRDEDFLAMAHRRDAFERSVCDGVPETLVLASRGERLPNTSALTFEGVESAALLMRLDDRGFAVSSGSACTAGRTDPSPTLLAMGLSPAQAHGTIRVSIGASTSESDLQRLAGILAEEIPRLR